MPLLRFLRRNGGQNVPDNTGEPQPHFDWLVGDEEPVSQLKEKIEERLRSSPIDYNSLSQNGKQVVLFLKDRGEASIHVNRQNRLTVARRRPSRLLYVLTGGLIS
jgi:hypothetical protein